MGEKCKDKNIPRRARSLIHAVTANATAAVPGCEPRGGSFLAFDHPEPFCSCAAYDTFVVINKVQYPSLPGRLRRKSRKNPWLMMLVIRASISVNLRIYHGHSVLRAILSLRFHALPILGQSKNRLMRT